MIGQFITTVLVIYGIHAVTRQGMILGGLYMKILYTLARWMNYPSKIMKPLFDCTPCMASVYGTISYFVSVSFADVTIFGYLVWVFSLCGFNYILNKLI